MNDFTKDNENISEQETECLEHSADSESNADEQEFSTIFSDPTEKRQAKPQDANKKRIMSVIAAVLAVAILASGSALIVKLIPKKESDENTSSALNEISVLELDYKLIDKVAITNQNGKFVFTADRTTKTEDGEETVSVEWLAEGYEKGKLSSTAIGDILSSLNDITATREITTKTAKDCGLENSERQIDIESEEYGNFSIFFGIDSPDNTGMYLKLSTKDTIYLVDSSLADGFEFNALDLAATTDFAAITVTDAMKDYTDTEGNLSTFDTLTISGKNFDEPVVFKANTDEFSSSFIPFVVQSPVQREADNLTDVMALFASGLTTNGAYSLDLSPESLKEVGLDNPDMVISISVAGVSKTYKISVVDDQYCAVIDNDSTLIQRVDKSNLAFIDYRTENFYSNWVFLRAIDQLNTLVFQTADTTYNFDISYTEEENSKTYTILHNGKKINAENFQDFYIEFVGLQSADYDIEPTSTAPEMTVTANFKSGKTEVLTFTRTSATKYQFSLDGEIKGRITSSAYNKVYNYLKLVAENKKIK